MGEISVQRLDRQGRKIHLCHEERGSDCASCKNWYGTSCRPLLTDGDDSVIRRAICARDALPSCAAHESTTLTTGSSSFCLSCGLSTLRPSCEVVCGVGSTTFFLLVRGSPSIRSIACLLTDVTGVVLLENHAWSFGCFRATSGLVDLGELGIDVGTDMDMVVNL